MTRDQWIGLFVGVPIGLALLALIAWWAHLEGVDLWHGLGAFFRSIR